MTGRKATRQPHPSYCPFHACQRVVCRCGILPDPPGREATCCCDPALPRPMVDALCTVHGNRAPEQGARCIVCASTQHDSEPHVRALPYDEAHAIRRDMTPCAAHFACIGRLTCQKPMVDRD